MKDFTIDNFATYYDYLNYWSSVNPQKEIVGYHGIEYTWRDIKLGTELIARDLACLGVNKNSNVGLLSRNNQNFIMAFLAIQKIGATAILMDFSMKCQEIQNCIECGKITHICVGDIRTTAKEKERVKEKLDSLHVFTYEIESNTYYSNTFELKVDAKSNKSDIAFFTSGTTGLPKYVVHSTSGLIKSCMDIVSGIPVYENDCICGCLPFFHAFGFLADFSVSLIYNIPIFIVRSNSDRATLENIRKNRCTILNNVPTRLYSFASYHMLSPKNVESLRLSIYGGMEISIEKMQMVAEKLPNVNFLPLYGMTEVAPITIGVYNDKRNNTFLNVGKIANNIKIDIRDVDTGRKVKNGDVGEIFVHSDRDYKTYVDGSSEMEKKECGWIMTGDLGYFDKNHYLILVGRSKELIFRSGEKISPYEVSQVIKQFEGIEDVLLFGIPDSQKNETLVAAIIMKKGSLLNLYEINKYARRQLTYYKIPNHYVMFDSFPLLANGKVDKSRIKDILEKAILGGQYGSESDSK